MWSFLFFGVVFVLSGVVRSTGAVVPPLLILVFALWGVRVPFAVWLQPVLGVDAIWWSFPVSAAVAMGLTLAYYRWGNWRQARMLPCEPDEVAIPSEVPAHVTAPVADAGARVEDRRVGEQWTDRAKVDEYLGRVGVLPQRLAGEDGFEVVNL